MHNPMIKNNFQLFEQKFGLQKIKNSDFKSFPLLVKSYNGFVQKVPI